MTFGVISETKLQRYGMNQNNYNDNDENVGIGIKRGAIQLNIGGIYKSKTDSQEYQLLEFIDLSKALFKNLTTLRTDILSIHDFENVVGKSNVSLLVDINNISDKDWEIAQKRYDAIKPIVTNVEDYQGRKGYDKREQETGISYRSLYRWAKAYRETSSLASLIDFKRGWQTGTRRIKPDQEQVITEVINDFYLTIQRPTIIATIEEVFRRCHKQNIKKPSKNAIRYQIERISEKDYLKGRGHRERAKNKFIAKTGGFPLTEEPLAVIQIDHTPADIILVDDTHRKPIGRPYITVAIDIYSRMITGYYISLDAPSVTSVGMCLSRSILPKDELLRKFDIDAKWDVFGIPKKIHVDNGSDFRADSLKKSCALYGIDIEFRPLARPEFGGHIERIIGNLMQKVHELPGTTYSNIREKDNYESEKHASLTLDEFEKWFLIQITKVYHQKVHSGIGRSPVKQWELGIFGDGINKGIGIPIIPVDAQALTLDFMPMIERTIQRQGVTIEGIHYYDPCLNHFINASELGTDKKRKFTFRLDPRDISQIWFFDPELKRYFKIPYANQALPQMSMWEYKVLRKQVQEQHKTVNDALIYAAWEEQQNLIESSKKNTKTARRQAQRKDNHAKSQGYHQDKDLQSDNELLSNEQIFESSSDKVNKNQVLDEKQTVIVATNSYPSDNDEDDDDSQTYYEDIE